MLNTIMIAYLLPLLAVTLLYYFTYFLSAYLAMIFFHIGIYTCVGDAAIHVHTSGFSVASVNPGTISYVQSFHHL